jgi:hypothetical protein
MYSHIRAGYTIFYYRKMWLNYIKKITLIQRLMGDRRNQFFFITNRLEHLHFLDSCANSIGGNTLFYEKAAQFYFKFGTLDARHIMGKKMKGLGVANFMGGKDYLLSPSKVFINIVNNSAKDSYYFKQLVEAELDFLTFSPADTNSLYVRHLLPLFGNNDSPRALNFYLSNFKRSALFKKTSRLSDFSTRSWLRVRPNSRTDEFLKPYYAFGQGHTRSAKASSNFSHMLQTKHSRAIRATALIDTTLKSLNKVHRGFDRNSGIFRFRKNFNYIKY